jgi:hypothetical protein
LKIFPASTGTDAQPLAWISSTLEGAIVFAVGQSARSLKQKALFASFIACLFVFICDFLLNKVAGVKVRVRHWLL